MLPQNYMQKLRCSWIETSFTWQGWTTAASLEKFPNLVLGIGQETLYIFFFSKATDQRWLRTGQETLYIFLFFFQMLVGQRWPVALLVR